MELWGCPAPRMPRRAVPGSSGHGKSRPMKVAREFPGRRQRKLARDCRSARGPGAREITWRRSHPAQIRRSRSCRQSRCFLGADRPGRSARMLAFHRSAHQTGIMSDIAIGGPRARPRRLLLLARTRRALIASVMLSRGSAQNFWSGQAATAGRLYRCPYETELAGDRSAPDGAAGLRVLAGWPSARVLGLLAGAAARLSSLRRRHQLAHT